MLHHKDIRQVQPSRRGFPIGTFPCDISICIYLITHFDLKILSIKIVSVRTKVNALETLNEIEELQIA